MCTFSIPSPLYEGSWRLLSEILWRDLQGGAKHQLAGKQQPQICRWHKKCRDPLPLDIYAFLPPLPGLPGLLAGFSASSQLPCAETANVCLLLPGNVAKKTEYCNRQKITMLSHFTLWIHKRYLLQYQITITFIFKSLTPRVMDAALSVAVRFALLRKNKWSSCRWSLKVAMYFTWLDESLQARANLWAAQATPTIFG